MRRFLHAELANHVFIRHGHILEAKRSTQKQISGVINVCQIGGERLAIVDIRLLRLVHSKPSDRDGPIPQIRAWIYISRERR
jgi:hypothetical protein